ncbi:NF038122 family metalloprotease [Leptothoe sp. EHU-05/26/07-4]
MVQFKLVFDPNVSLEQRLGFQMAANIWASFLIDNTNINLRIGSTDELGENGQAVGGAIPIFHETHYGVYKDYLEDDATSNGDTQVLDALQVGNTVDILVDDELVNENTSIMLTRAQAKALGMEEELILEDGNTWDRDVLQDPNALDGYIQINNSYNWNYDFTREFEAPENTLDFLTMALHEIGHNLGFVSGLDGLVETFELHSGETRTEGFTSLDLMRYSETSAKIENPDGKVSDLSFGSSAYFSIDGGITTAAEFEEGNEYQASHWQRFQNALGIMDPTLGYQERTDISYLDLQAFDVLGWDVNYTALQQNLDFQTLHTQSQQVAITKFGDREGAKIALTNTQDWQILGYEAWFEAFQGQILEQGWGSWFQNLESRIFEQGWGTWFQDFEAQLLEQMWGTWFQNFEAQVLEQGWGTWFQNFEAQVLEQGWGTWYQNFESQTLNQNWGTWWQEFDEHILNQSWGTWFQNFDTQILEQGWGTWFQKFEAEVLEQSWGTWWQQIEQYSEMIDAAVATTINTEELQANITGGHADDILAGNYIQNLISGTGGNDLLDGEDGDDIILGGEGNDIAYGWNGQDILLGGKGDDLLLGENDNDHVYGEDGHDILAGGRGDDILDGGNGRDVLKGDTGHDDLNGGAGDDKLTGNSGEDLLIGGKGQDTLEGGNHDDVLYGDDYFIPLIGTKTISNNRPRGNAVFDSVNPLVDLDFWTRLEVEDMKLRNYSKDDQFGASGSTVVKTQGKGTAKTKFNGPSGIYDLIVGYEDQARGSAEITLVVIGKESQKEYTWQLDGNAGPGTYTITGISLETGDTIKLKGKADGKKDLARLDYVDIITSKSAIGVDTNIPSNDNFYQYLGGNDGQPADLRIEAEDLELTGGYTQFDSESASGDMAITTLMGLTGIATYTHTGSSGIYNLYANYFDSSAGNAQAEVFLNGVSLTSWEFNLDDDAAHEKTLGLGITLNTGDVIQIQGQEGFGASVASLVTNGSFENNSIATNSWGLVNSLLGWSSTGQSMIEVQELTNWFGNADEGGAWLELDSNGNGGVAQTLATTTQAEYQLSFSYSPRPGIASASNGIAVYWDGRLLDTISRSGGSQNAWQTYTYDVTASNSSTVLEFQAIGSSDGVGAFLDNVKVQSILATDQAIIDYLLLEQVPNTTEDEPLAPNISASAPKQLSLFNGVYVDASIDLLNFDGSNDYGELTGTETGGAMTFSAWVNYTNFNHWSRIFDFGDGAAQNNVLLANERTTNNLVFEVHADGARHRLTINDFWQANTWMHITATIDESGRMRIYRDGALAGETTSSIIPSVKTRINYIGRSHWSNDGYFDGQLKDVDLLNEALDEAAVRSLYSEGLQESNVNVETINNQPLDAITIQLEVEDMDLSGLRETVERSFASGGSYIRTATKTNLITDYENVYVSDDDDDDDDDDDGYWTTRPVYRTETTATGMQISSTSLFSGETGTYDVVVGYYDENDGAAEIIIKVDNQEVDRWFADQNLGSNEPNISTFTTRTVVQGLQISNLDLIEIIAIGDNGDRANLDYIQFIKAAELPTPGVSDTLPILPSGAPSGNDDVLQGGAGNDTAYGGEGNDIVYGDEGNDILYGDFATIAPFSLQNGAQVNAATGVLSFDGNDDYGEISSLETGGLMTFAAWVNYDSFNYWSRIFDFGDGPANNNIVLANKQGTNTLGLHIYEGNQSVGVLEIENFWQTDTWIHVTATIDALGTIRIYKNGALAGEAVSNVVPISKVRTHNYIGKSHWTQDGAFDGELHDVRVLDGVLNENAVQALYNETLLNFHGETHNGSLYLLTDSVMTWDDAQAYAESLGGNLVTINDLREEAWVQSTFGTTEGFWIGINDRLVEGQFEWVSGEAITYTNWAPGEPNNYDGNQDYGWINYGSANQWDDTSSTNKRRGIIEIKTISELGNDTLIGGAGHDHLYGDGGNDILNGTDSVAIGSNEQDHLTGGSGADQFILGDINQAYYSKDSELDYVIVTDFTVGIDMLQLHGAAADYHQSSQGNDVFLYYGTSQDLIARLDNISSLDLNSSVTFV